MSNRYTIGKFGVISEVKKGFVRVAFEDDDIVSNWLPVMVRKSLTDKESWPYEIQEHVFCMMDENCEYGIVQGAVYNDVDTPDAGEAAGIFRKKFSDGTILQYDKGTHEFKADIKGKAKIIATDDIEATSSTNIKAVATVKATVQAPAIELTGNVVVSGSLSAASIVITGGGSMSSTGDISTTGDVLAGGKSLKTHIHGGVQTGLGNTGMPV